MHGICGPAAAGTASKGNRPYHCHPDLLLLLLHLLHLLLLSCRMLQMTLSLQQRRLVPGWAALSGVLLQRVWCCCLG
jgi:hypothetical protein